MPTQDEDVSVNFVEGLDTRSDEHTVVQGKLLACHNYTLSKNNALTKCDGWKALVTVANANGLATLNNELLVTTSTGDLYSVTGGEFAGSGVSTANQKSGGIVSPLTLTKQRIRRNAGYQIRLDMDSAVFAQGMVSAHVWLDYSADATTILGISCTIIDEATGDVLLDAVQLVASATVTVPRVVAIPSAVAGASDKACFVVIWQAGAGTLTAIPIDMSTGSPVVGAAVALALDADLGHIDAAADQGNALVVYTSSDVTNSAWLCHIVYSGGTMAMNSKTALSTQATRPDANIVGVGLGWFGTVGSWGALELINVGPATAGMNSAVITTTPTTIVNTTGITVKDAGAAPTGLYSCITATAHALGLIIFSDRVGDWGSGGAGGVVLPIRWTVINAANGIVNGPATLINSNSSPGGMTQGPYIAAKALNFGGKAYLPVYIGGLGGGLGTNQQCTWFLLQEGGDTTAQRIAATALQGVFGLPTVGGTPYGGTPASCANVNGGIGVPVTERGELFTVGGVSFLYSTSQVGYSRLSLFPSSLGVPQARTQLGTSAYFAGGVLAAYDGHRVFDAGFLTYPEGIAIANGGVGVVTDGTRQYCAVYEWVDGQGQRHQSAVSPAVQFVAAGGPRAYTVTVPTTSLTMKGIANITIVVFRTVSLGSTFYRLNAVNQPVYNLGTAASVTVSDNVLDTALVANEPLYTTGGQLPNIPPPPCSALVVHQGRLFQAGLEDPEALQFSQTYVSGFGLQFSDLLGGRVDETSGGTVALASQDDRLLILCARKLYAVLGQGPDGAGRNSGYSPPESIPTDAGCIERRSVLETPHGIVFKSLKGWQLLKRGVGVEYIGAGPEAFNDAAVIASVMAEDRREARFYSPAGGQLYWCYDLNQWTERLFTALGRAVYDAIWWPGAKAAVFLQSAGEVDIDLGAGLYGEGVATVSVGLVDTGWLHLAKELSGFQRCKWLVLEGPFIGRSSLTLTMYVDYDSTAVGTVTIADTATLETQAGNAWRVRWRLPRQKCSAIRFRIQDIPLDPTFGGLNLSGLTLRVGLKKGAAKLPAGQSV